MDEKYYFYVCNSDVLRDENDLLSELGKIDPLAFSYHVNSEKNDFYNWVKEALKNESLAKKIQKVKDKDEMIKIVNKEVISLAKKRNKRNKKNVISQIKEAVLNG